MNNSLSQHAAEYIRSNPGERFTADEIASGVIEKYPGRFVEKGRKLGGRTDLHDQITREIYAQRRAIQKKGILVDTSHRPMRWFFDNEGIIAPEMPRTAEQPAKRLAEDVIALVHPETLNEADLYAPLQDFLRSEMNVFTKRIRESTSSNKRGKNGNLWLHPDIVGMLAPGLHWNDLVQKCATELPTTKARLVAVEVKVSISASDIRESFFQTVSNSLWANKAYLAAVEIKGEEALEELNMLCALHGVGYISIDTKNISESRVLIQPREREDVDWANANRIAVENADFRDYLQNVLNYLQTGEVRHRLWHEPRREND